MAEIKIERATKQFGRIVAVDDVSLEVPDGKFVVLVGPSGCGKTTLLRLLAGLEELTSGRIYIGGQDVTQRPPRERDVAMVFQSYALYPHMSVRKNLSFSLELRKTPREEIERRVQRAAAILGIGDLLERQPKQLSGGQRQRVAVGRAIVREPAVFLFDEPLSNLDAKLRTAMRSELIKLHRQLKATIVYVTHDQVEAMTMGELVVVMNDGLVQQQGPPIEIYKKPNNLFVAEFIGSPAMNFLRGGFDPERNEAVISDSEMRVKLPPAFKPALLEAGSDALVFGIRPEHLYTTVPQGEAGEFQRIRGCVEVVEPLGAETILEISVASHSLVARAKGDVLPEPGSGIELYLDPRRVHVFDGRSGMRVSPAEGL